MSNPLFLVKQHILWEYSKVQGANWLWLDIGLILYHVQNTYHSVMSNSH